MGDLLSIILGHRMGVLVTLEEKAVFLQHVSLFADLDARFIYEIAKLVNEVTYVAGEMIIEEGEDSDAMYVVVDGVIDVLLRRKDRDQVVVAKIGKHNVLGEMALITNQPRNAACMCVEESRLLKINRDDFRLWVTSYPEILLNISHLLVARVNETNKLFEEAIQKDAELRRELKIAEQIQQDMFPERVPKSSHFDVDGYSKPARTIGGDLFDFVTLNDKLGVMIGDVTGKSVSAALLMAISQGFVGMASRYKSSPAEILHEVNLSLCDYIVQRRFVSLCYAEFDPHTHQLTYSMAGLPQPILVRDGMSQNLDWCDNRLPLGQIKTAKYDQKVVEIQAGDIIIFTTDGIEEANNADGKLYGINRLFINLKNIDPNLTAAQIRMQILADIKNFVGNAEQHDDMTLIVVKVL